MLRSKKKEYVAFLEEVYKSVGAIVVVHYHGLTVAQLTKLRKNLRKEEAKLKVIKNTLARIAVSNTNLEEINLFSGPVAIAYSKDVIAAPKIIVEFAKNNTALKIVGGIINNKLATINDVNQLAKLSSLESVKVEFISLLQMPARRFIAVLQSPLLKIITVLKVFTSKSN